MRHALKENGMSMKPLMIHQFVYGSEQKEWPKELLSVIPHFNPYTMAWVTDMSKHRIRIRLLVIDTLIDWMKVMCNRRVNEFNLHE